MTKKVAIAFHAIKEKGVGVKKVTVTFWNSTIRYTVLYKSFLQILKG